jgi:sugar phosphate isomerase/epimerase
MADKHPIIGVSPAYFISRFSNRFTPEEVGAGLKELAKIGFDAFQLEVFHRETLADWVHSGVSRVCRASADLGMKATQCVAHFMMEAFSSRERLFSDAGIMEMQSLMEIVARYDECGVVTVPLGAFEAPRIPKVEEYRDFFDRCVEKIGRLLGMVEEAGKLMALEILPSAIVGGIDGFMRLCDRLNTATLGLNFDTGHAWAAKENLYLVPAKLGRRIMGTHLCDNFGNENLSLRPGAGSIDWPRLIETLQSSGYEGAFDIEIICRPEEVRDEYAKARAYIATLLSE